MKMKQLARWKTFNRLVFLSLWIAGLILIWQLTTVGGREGWQIPDDEFWVGYLRDGVTLATIPRSPNGDRMSGTKESGPIRVWNTHTGQLLAEHFSKQFVFDRVHTDVGDRLQIQEEVEGNPGSFQLRLVDALTAKEICTFLCRVPQKNIWWMTTPDGKYTIFQSFEGEKPHIELREIESKRLIKRIDGWREPMRFSPDGSLFFATGENRRDMGIFSTTDGGLLMHIKPEPKDASKSRDASPNSISPDNTLLVDSSCRVWDVKTGKQRFSVPNIYYASMTFTPDSRYLVVAVTESNPCYLAWYDAQLGKEDTTRRTPLAEGKVNQMTLSGWHGNADARKKYLVASGTLSFVPAPTWKKWLAKIPRLEFVGQDSARDAYYLVDPDTAQVVCTGPERSAFVSPDAQTLVISARDNRYELCDIPPSKPIKRYLLLCAGFSLLLALPILVRRWWGRGSVSRPVGAFTSPLP